MLADFVVLIGGEARWVVFGAVDRPLRQRGIELAPSDRGRRAAHGRDHVHRRLTVDHANFKALQIVRCLDRLVLSVEVAAAGIIVAQTAQEFAFALLQQSLADHAVKHIPVVVGIAEHIGQAVDRHGRNEILHRGGRCFGHRQRTILQLFHALHLGTEHRARIDIDRHRTAGQCFQPLFHEFHAFVNRMTGIERMPELQHHLLRTRRSDGFLRAQKQ